MNEYNFYTGDPDYMDRILEMIETITADDMRKTAQKYFTENYARLLIVPGVK
jgi:predicted Zn-dependent peptidase